jgi:hypothetical protein
MKSSSGDGGSCCFMSSIRLSSNVVSLLWQIFTIQIGSNAAVTSHSLRFVLQAFGVEFLDISISLVLSFRFTFKKLSVTNDSILLHYQADL